VIIPTLSSRRLVGREAELHSLDDARRDLARGRGCTVLIGGEAGIGKTRLVTEFSASLTSARAPRFLVGESLQEAPRPFGPFRTVLAALAHAARTTAAQPPLVERALAALIPDAMSAAGAPLSAGPVEKSELFAGVLGYLESIAAKRATIIALEDLHWADTATLDLLVFIAPRVVGTRLMILGTYRIDEITAEHPFFSRLARLEREPAVRRIVLEPLVEQDVRTLIRAALGTKYTLSQDQIRDVIARAEGNPFFAEEILKNVVEHRRESAVPLPTSVRALTLHRVSTLAAQDRNVLDFAAVFGMHFDADTVATLTGADRQQVLRSLRALRDVNLIVEDDAGAKGFRFRHVLTRQVIYDGLLAAETQELHARIVASLETFSDRDERADQLAYHAWKAGLTEPTMRYSERAGDLALTVSAAAQAAAYFERALQIAIDPDDRVRLLGKAGEAYVQQSDFSNAIARCLEQHELLVARGELAAAAFALTRAAGEIANGGDVHRALAVVEAFRREYAGRIPDAAADHVHASFGRLATACDQYETARDALALVQNPDALAAHSHQVYWLAQLFCAEHFVDAALWTRASAALRARNAQARPLMRSQMLHSIASTGLTFAENEAALRSVDEALAIDRELGYARAAAYANAVKACVLCLQGRLLEARSCIVAALSEPDMFVVRLELALGASPVAIALDDAELAERLLDDAVLGMVRAAKMDGAASAMLGMQAAWLHGRGRTDEARRLLNDAVDGSVHQFAVVHFWPFAARHVDDARLAHLRRLCAERAVNPANRVAQACSALLDAVGEQRAHDPQGAATADHAASRYRELGWPLLEALAMETAGRTNDALVLYRSAGSLADVRRLEMGKSAAKSRNVGSTRLSPREREVAGLVAKGLSNRLIAQALSIGEKTIEKYVSGIYSKLGFSTRAQLAAHVARAEAKDA